MTNKILLLAAVYILSSLVVKAQYTNLSQTKGLPNTYTTNQPGKDFMGIGVSPMVPVATIGAADGEQVPHTGATTLAIGMGDVVLSTCNGRHSLRWNAYNENRNGYFEVQRSADGRYFTTVGKVESSGRPNAYSYTDAGTHPGVSYYRIRMVNGNDGTSTYTNTVIGNTSPPASDLVSVYPIPARGILNISVTGAQNGTGTLILIDGAGKEVQRVNTSDAALQMDIHGMPAGLYFLNYRQDGLSQTIRVVVE